MKRRTVLQLLLGLVAALPQRIRAFAQTPALSPADVRLVSAIADVVLPSEIGADGRARVVTAFARWLRDYRAGADTDHGYGFTRLRRTGASPAAKYPAQIAALQQRAGAQGFASLEVDARRVILEEAIAVAKIERLPERPDGGHIATDLMAFYFNSVEANDLAYRAAIGRDTCRGLEESADRPKPLGASQDRPRQERD
jgi:hypothetical protein